MSNRAAIGSLSGGTLGGHQSQKGRQLANVFGLAPVPGARQQLGGHNPADAGAGVQIVDTERELWVRSTIAARLASARAAVVQMMRDLMVRVGSYYGR